MNTIGLPESYSAVAKEYTSRIFNELKDKPMDRGLLDRVATELGPTAKVCDLGCGPGQVAKYLYDRNLSVTGIDVSQGMIDQAMALNPQIEFYTGNMKSLKYADGHFDGIVAFYSIIHIHPDEIPATLREIKRVIRPGGWFLFSFHIGEENVHLNEWWEIQINIDFYFFQTEFMKGATEEAGFRVVEIIEREPYSEDVEHQSRRAYFLLEASK